MKVSDLCGRNHRRSGYPVCPCLYPVSFSVGLVIG
jgi:hypothetical protein